MRNYLYFRQILYGLILIGICLAVSLYEPQNPLVKVYAHGDTSIYQYFGKMMWQGYMPYRDIFDHKGPLVFVWNMLGYGIDAMWGQWLLELLLLVGIAGIAFSIGCRYVSSFLSFLIASVVLLLIPDEDTIGNSENLSVFLNFVFLYCCTRYIRYPRLSFGMMGVILASQLFVKPTHVAMGGMFAIGIFYQLWQQKQYQLMKDFIFYATIGFILVCEVWVLWLQAEEMLVDFYRDYILFNLQYTSYWRENFSAEFIVNHYLHNTVIQLMIGLMVVAWLVMFRADKSLKQMVLLSTLTIIVSSWLIVMPHHPVNHYIYILYPMLWLLLILICLRFKRYSYLVIAAIGILFVWAVQTTNQHIKSALRVKPDANSVETALFLRKQLQPQETFVVIGYEMCRIYLMIDVPLPMRYVMNGTMMRINPNMICGEIKSLMPKFVLLRVEEIQRLADNINTYWPQFGQQYQEVMRNGEYYVFKRIID